MWVESGWLSEMRPKSSPILMLYLLHRQTPLVKKSIVIFFKKYTLVIFLLLFLDISSAVLTESQDRMQNFIGGVQNTINNVSKIKRSPELDIKVLGYLEY